jgi:hypothetical protein
MNKDDYERAIKTDPHMPRTRAKLAIPFVGKGKLNFSISIFFCDVTFRRAIKKL